MTAEPANGGHSAYEVACATWSSITEPGDEFGGYLRHTLGVEEALRAIRDDSLDEIYRALQTRGSLDEGVDRFGDLRDVLSDSKERYLPRIDLKKIDLGLSLLQRSGWLVTPDHSDWPTALGDLGWGAPAALWGIGNRSALASLGRAISIVGSRGASTYGEWVTLEFAAELVNRGFAVVSGGAYGIDGIAHRAALRVEGTTVAVMAGGIDRLYPSGHQSMFAEICKTGAIISELSPGASPTKWRFLQRNRLIAALGNVTLVVEAGSRSGSINTANHALALGRPIAAIPGPVTASSSAGTNRLIAEGTAQLVVTPSDLAALAGDSDYLSIPTDDDDLGDLEKRALDAISLKPASAAEIAQRAGLTSQELAMAMGQLLLIGRVSQKEGGYFKVKQTTI
ncbi:MAG: DNA-protecting protein DprA [Microbacteriaceae bacterium]|nr:DNA-protecting protein DprA [Microbacteriaceae bacterium]